MVAMKQLIDAKPEWLAESASLGCLALLALPRHTA
jgi:hypothetical protein